MMIFYFSNSKTREVVANAKYNKSIHSNGKTKNDPLLSKKGKNRRVQKQGTNSCFLCYNPSFGVKILKKSVFL